MSESPLCHSSLKPPVTSIGKRTRPYRQINEGNLPVVTLGRRHSVSGFQLFAHSSSASNLTPRHSKKMPPACRPAARPPFKDNIDYQRKRERATSIMARLPRIQPKTQKGLGRGQVLLCAVKAGWITTTVSISTSISRSRLQSRASGRQHPRLARSTRNDLGSAAYAMDEPVGSFWP